LPSERHAIALRFEHRCACCRVLLPVGWHLDHRVALADGGADDATNMQPLCPHCHTLKTAHENSGRVLLF
jgi:5-methylcytosine-specific restriction endonuclease McrA